LELRINLVLHTSNSQLAPLCLCLKPRVVRRVEKYNVPIGRTNL